MNTIQHKQYEKEEKLVIAVLEKAFEEKKSFTITDADLDRVYFEIEGEDYIVRMWNITDRTIEYTLFKCVEDHGEDVSRGVYFISRGMAFNYDEEEEEYTNKNRLVEILTIQNDCIDNELSRKIRASILEGKPLWWIFEEYDDAVAIDGEVIRMAIELGWNYKEYWNDNLYNEENDDEYQAYLDESVDITNAALSHIYDTLKIEIKDIEEE